MARDIDPFKEQSVLSQHDNIITLFDSPKPGKNGRICHPEFAWRHIKSTHAPLEYLVRFQGRMIEIRRSMFTPHTAIIRNRNSGTFVFLQLKEYDNHEKGQFYAAIETVTYDGNIP